MGKGINIPFNIQGLRQAKEDLAKVGEEFEKFKNDPVKSKKLAKEFNELSAAIDETQKELIELNKAGKLVGTRFDDINEILHDTNEEILPLSSQIGEMEDRLYQLAKAGDTSSVEFKALQKEIVENRKVIRQIDKDIDLLAENQGLSVFATGWGQVGDSLLSLNFEQAAKDAESLSSSVGNLGKIGASSLKSLGQTVGTLGKTFAKFGASLLLNPIFLLVAVIGAIIAGIVALLDYLGFLEPILTAIGDAVGWVIEQFKALLDWIGLTNYAEQEAAEEARKKKVAESKKYMEQREHERRVVESAIEDEIAGLDRTIALYQAQGKSVVEVTKQKINAQIELIKLQDTSNSKAREYIAIAEDYLFQSKKATDELNKEKKDVQNQILALENELKIVDEEASQAAADRAKERAQTALDIARQLEDLRLEQLKDGYEKEKQLVEVEFRRQREDVLANEQYTQEQKQALIEELKRVENKRILDLDNERIEKQRQLEADALKFKQEAEQKAFETLEAANEEIYQNQLTDQQREIEAVQYKYDELINLARIYGEDTTALEAERQRQLSEIENTYNRKRIQDEQNLLDAKLNLTKDSLSLVSEVTELFGKKNEKSAKRAFEVSKAAQIAQAIISTYQGANAIFASAAANPATVLFPAQPFIAAGIAISNGLLNVAKISQTKFQGGNTSGGGGGGSAPSALSGGASISSASPSFNLFGQSNALDEVQGSESVETNQNIVVQAVVSETEVTGTQNKIKNIQKNAEL